MARLRWRLHGAWMWPTFVVLTLVDGVIVHWRPPSGDGESTVSGWLIGLFLSLLAIIIGMPIAGRVIRRLRPDMPKVVARDYGGTVAICGVTIVLLAAGLAHHSAIASDQRTLEDATARAVAYIGVHAPASFRENLGSASTWVIESGRVYRTCVRDRPGSRTYCVIVKPRMAWSRSVTFAGYEPNSVLSQGTG